ncbi:MAG: hypothetical protein ABJ004_02170 [Cyclobacteriaceae bacterium]
MYILFIADVFDPKVIQSRNNANYKTVFSEAESAILKYFIKFIKISNIIMPITVRDFVPEKSKGGMFKSGKVQHFDEVLASMNQWIDGNPNIEIVNIETVLLPNIHDSNEEGSQDTELWTGGESSSQWYQLLRVWYKE